MARGIEFDSNFSKGLNVDVSKPIMTKEELVKADNAEILPRGGLRKRTGIESINAAPYDFPITQIFSFPKPDGTEELLAISNQTLYKVNKTDGTMTSLQAINNDRVPYFFLRDNMYFIDTGHEYYEYDGTSVSAVVGSSETDNDLGPIKRCTMAIYHAPSTRVFFSGDTQNPAAVYFSEYNQPEYVKGTSVVHPTRNNGPVKNLTVLMDGLIVFYHYSGRVWRGVDPERDAIWEEFPTPYGPINEDLVNLTTDSLSLVAEGGIMRLSPSIIGVPMDMEIGSSYIANISKDRINNILKNITEPDLARSVFDPDDSKYYLSYCDDESGSNNQVLVFDWQQQAFTRYTDININDFTKIADGTLYLAGDNYIGNFGDDYQDSIAGVDTIITMDVETPIYTFDNPVNNKVISRIFLLYKNFGPNSNVEVDLLVDGELVFSFELEGDNSQKDYLACRKKTTWSGRDFQLKIKNDQYSPTEIYAIGFIWKVGETGGEVI